MEHLEKIIGKTFSDINSTNVFLGQSPKAIEIKNKNKKQPTEWEKISANDVTDKGLISKIHKHLLQLNNKQPNQKMDRKSKETFLQRNTDGQ